MRETSVQMVAACAVALGVGLSGCLLNGGPLDGAGTGGSGTTGTPTTTGTGTIAPQGGSGATSTAGAGGETTAMGGAGGAAGDGGAATTDTATSTTATITTPVCGNGVMEADEDCDDGDAVEGDGCFQCERDCGCTGCQAGTRCNDCPSAGQTTYKDPAGKHCYAHDPTTKNWPDARTACMGLGDGWDLFAPSTSDEMTMLMNVSAFSVSQVLSNSSNRLWTGANDQVVEGTFVWSNGESWVAPPDGLSLEAVSATEDCLAAGKDPSSSVTLRGRNCTSDSFPFVCEHTP